MGRKYAIPQAFASSQIDKPTDNKKKLPRRYVDVYEDDTREGERIEGESYLIQNAAIDKEDDEEISEDDVFNESDEEKWGGYFVEKREKVSTRRR
jgi:hypothetical protein